MLKDSREQEFQEWMDAKKQEELSLAHDLKSMFDSDPAAFFEWLASYVVKIDRKLSNVR